MKAKTNYITESADGELWIGDKWVGYIAYGCVYMLVRLSDATWLNTFGRSISFEVKEDGRIVVLGDE